MRIAMEQRIHAIRQPLLDWLHALPMHRLHARLHFFKECDQRPDARHPSERPDYRLEQLNRRRVVQEDPRTHSIRRRNRGDCERGEAKDTDR